MTFGFNPYISKESPFHGAVYAVVETVAKIVAMGGDYKRYGYRSRSISRSLVKTLKSGASLLPHCLAHFTRR